MMKNSNHTPKQRLLALCLMLAMLLSLVAGCKAPAEPEQAVETTVPATTEASKEMSFTDLMKSVFTLKSDLETAMDDMEAGQLDSAREKVAGLPAKTGIIRESLDASLENLGQDMPALKDQLINIQGLMDLVELASQSLLMPAIDYLQSHPLTTLKSGDGIDTRKLCEYITFAESLMPQVEQTMDLAGTLDLSIVDEDGELTEKLETANQWLDRYRQDNTLFAKLRTMLGAEGDRLYLFVPQGPAEIRASGGFPGVMGMIRIENGVMVLQEFDHVHTILPGETPWTANITAAENRLFYRLYLPWDADFCPDYERAAEIWALSYESRWRKPLDGVLAASPVIVQKLLGVLDEEIRLFDGRTLDGTNAMKQLQRNINFDYFGRPYAQNAKNVTNQLFADAANKTRDVLLNNMEFSDLGKYLSVTEECIADRTLMLWMTDEQEQEIMRSIGCHGGLNTDPEKPQAGVYYSLTVACKMGWFLKMDTEMGEGTANADGSYTYPVTVTLTNTVTKEEVHSAGEWITGGAGGVIGGSAYFFAPAGGTVSDFVTSDGSNITLDEYNGLQLGHLRTSRIPIGGSVTITYNLTTAPGVDTLPVFSTTPTAQAYH